ncbi:MAG: type I-E CRISPR-associated protein Cse1/CasA [Candidatus Rokuibacteriota bacterium]
MSFSFNLVDQPWIPSRFLTGSAARLGLRDVLARAPDIEQIADPCPLVTAALHRLLLAVLHRVFGPRTTDDWAALWNAGGWPLAPLDAYLYQWRGRFDLFDPLHPFYQVASLDEARAVPSSKLLPELASGNNATLFDHTTDDSPPGLTPAVAATYLVAAQAFFPGGLVSTAPDGDRSAKAAPLVKGAVVMTRGRSLFETLMLNLLRYDPRTEQPFGGQSSDAPAWERPAIAAPEVRRPAGYLDLLTWQSRWIRLLPTVGPDAPTEIRSVIVTKGTEFPGDFTLRDHETMIAFRKSTKGDAPWLPVAFSPSRVLWRDSLAMLQSIPARQARPRIVDWLGQLTDEARVETRATISMDVLGLSSDQAKLLFWRHERFALPPAYVGRDGDLLLGRVRIALDASEVAAAALWEAAKRLAREVLEGTGARTDPKRITEIAERFGIARAYWSRLELPFRRMFEALPGVPEAELATGYPGPLAVFVDSVERVARQAWAEALSGLDGPRTLRAATIADDWFQPALAARVKKALGLMPEEVSS